jgi:hypothetical protein
VELLHDLLCLANSYHEGDRYLLFGQSDTGVKVGVANDQNRVTNAALHDFLRQSYLNRIPSLELNFEQIDGMEFGLIQIKNRPDKPFFVTHDKSFQGRTLRAGVIYTRLGDSNVPMRESAPEEMVELMWRERFGLGLTPLERFHRLLDERANWIEIKGEGYRYHREFPEFTIRDGKTINARFNESWTRKFPDPNTSSYYKEVYYLTTLLDRMVFVSCDGGRFEIPLPEPREGGTYFLRSNSVAMKLASQLWQYLPLEDTIRRVGIEIT